MQQLIILAILPLILVGCAAVPPLSPTPITAPTPTAMPELTAALVPTSLPANSSTDIVKLTKDLAYTIPLVRAVLEQKLEVYCQNPALLLLPTMRKLPSGVGNDFACSASAGYQHREITKQNTRFSQRYPSRECPR